MSKWTKTKDIEALKSVLNEIGNELNRLYAYVECEADIDGKDINRILHWIDEIGTTCDYYNDDKARKESCLELEKLNNIGGGR